MDNEAHGVTEHSNGNERRQHGQPPAITFVRIHGRLCPQALPELSKRALLAPSRSISQIVTGFTGELLQFFGAFTPLRTLDVFHQCSQAS
jgi:hypothetical protein